MLTQEILDLLNEPPIEKVYDPKLLKLPKYKEHLEGNIHYLDEAVSVDQFKRETNCDSSGFYEPSTNNVVCYVESKYWEDLIGKHVGMPKFITYYDDGLPQVVIENFTMDNGWTTTVDLSIGEHRGNVDLKADTGATFSVINLETLCTALSINSSVFKSMLNAKKYSLVSVTTANGNVQYFAITAVLHAFNENIPIILYIDPKNRLKQPLLGFDIITSLEMICKPGQPPTVLKFDRSVNSEYIKKNNTADNASVDLYTLFLETQNSDKSTHAQTTDENTPIKERIVNDLHEYGISIGVTDPEKIIAELLQSTPHILESADVADYKPGIQAWTILQILNNSPLRYHESEDLGAFIYNTDMYRVANIGIDGYYHLHYNPKFKGTIELPEGCINTSCMFYRCELPEGFTLVDKFNTSNVINMSLMFRKCKLPKGFTLGDKFDTGSVTDMSEMFHECELPESFSLGDKFDTSNVAYMSSMFRKCELPDGFTLGAKFNTSKVTNMDAMFMHCRLHNDFTLGDKFDTSNVITMRYMFTYCKLPENFTLGDKFRISSNTDTYLMFDQCQLPRRVKLDYTKNVIAQLSQPNMNTTTAMSSSNAEGKKETK